MILRCILWYLYNFDIQKNWVRPGGRSLNEKEVNSLNKILKLEIAFRVEGNERKREAEKAESEMSGGFLCSFFWREEFEFATEAGDRESGNMRRRVSVACERM